MNIFRSVWRGCLDICISACSFDTKNNGLKLHARAIEVVVFECTIFGRISFKTKNVKLSGMIFIIACLVVRLSIFIGAVPCRSADLMVMVVFPRQASR